MGTKVHAIQCPKCHDIIYSRAHHDFHSCTCGACKIDGGFDYMRVLWSDEVGGPPPSVTKIVKASKEELYADWNYSKDQFGWIHPKTKRSGTLNEALNPNQKNGNPKSSKKKSRRVRKGTK